MSPLPFTDLKLLDEIKKFTRTKTIKAGETLITPGDKVVFVPIVLKRAMRIIKPIALFIFCADTLINFYADHQQNG